MAESRLGVRIAQPLYLAVAERLAEGIAAGEYVVGTMLPTESELCTRFNASRFTVREAVKQLQALGLVVTRRGTGTEIVAQRPTSGGRFSYSFDSVPDFLHSARATRLVNIVAEDVLADRALVTAMGCKLRDPLLRLRGTRVLLTPKRRPGRPVAVTEVHVLGAYGGIRGELANLDTSISALIEKNYGVRPASIEQIIEPCVVSASDAETLNVASGSLGIRVTRRYFDSKGGVFEHATSVQAGEDSRLTMTIRSSRP
jgi:DNA-binding GntR family transcriptional regulator